MGNHANDIGFEMPEGPVCKFDPQSGKAKSGKEIFEGGVNFFASGVAEGDRELAARLTRKNMKALSYWQARPFEELSGPVATDEEFRIVMAKL